jgi:hypothetical protein
MEWIDRQDEKNVGLPPLIVAMRPEAAGKLYRADEQSAQESED